MKRDLTKAQFEHRMTKLGFEKGGFMGYWALPAPNNHTNVSAWNGGKRRRDQLRYMINANKQVLERQAKEAA